MPFQKIEAQKLSSSVTHQIEELILQGVLRPGERLPAERELAETMGVSRPSLREALAQMQADGLLVARAGSGIYVAEVLGSAFSPALVRLISRHPDAAEDYLSFRKDLEGLAAERAARNGSQTDLAVIDRAFTQMRDSHGRSDPQAEAALDASFHMAIVEASHNVIALHMMRAMQDLLREGMLWNRSRMFVARPLRDALLEQHGAINAAIQSRDGNAARDQIERHLDFVAARLTEQRRADERDQIARLRLRHDQSPESDSESSA